MGNSAVLSCRGGPCTKNLGNSELHTMTPSESFMSSTLNKNFLQVSRRIDGYYGGKIASLAFAPSSNLLVAGGTDGTLKFLTLFPKGLDYTLDIASSVEFLCMEFTNHSHSLFIGCSDGNVLVIDVKQRKIIQKIKVSSQKIIALAISPNQEILAVVTSDEKLVLIDIFRDSPFFSYEFKSSPNCQISLTFDNESRFLALTCGPLYFYDCEKKQMKSVNSAEQIVASFRYSSKSNELLCVTADKLHLIKYSTGKVISTTNLNSQHGFNHISIAVLKCLQ